MAQNKYDNSRYDCVGQLVTDQGHILLVSSSTEKAQEWAKLLNKLDGVKKVSNSLPILIRNMPQASL